MRPRKPAAAGFGTPRCSRSTATGSVRPRSTSAGTSTDPPTAHRRGTGSPVKAGYHGLLVRIFRRRTRPEEVLREHLQRLGVSSFWLRSALDAIHYCEQGDFFQPVFSVAGPAPARSVVALMRLEPFVRGEIDWTISPSESPFWVGSVGELQDELFDATASRFLDLYWSDHNPSVRPDLEVAFRAMVTIAEHDLPEATRAQNEDARHRRWALGSAGYVWRVAERTARTSD